MVGLEWCTSCAAAADVLLLLLLMLMVQAQCTFGAKLSDEEVQDLVQYVQDQAAAGWKAQ
jgi:hypothetical protein